MANNLAPADHMRTTDGRFISPLCADPNCGGQLVRDTEEAWPGGPQWPILRCDGLTHDNYGPLVACSVQHDAWRGED